MNSGIAHDLKDITDEWFDANADRLSKGIEISGPLSLMKFETTVISCVLNLATLLLGHILRTVFESANIKKTAGKIVRRNSKKKIRNVCLKDVNVHLLTGGSATIKTPYYLPRANKGRGRPKTKRGMNGSGLYPVLQLFGIEDKVTPALRAEVAREVTEGPSMDWAKHRLDERGIVFDIKKVRRISENFAKDSLSLRKSALEDFSKYYLKMKDLAGSIVLVCLDGGRLRTKVNKKGRRNKKTHRHRYCGKWKEPKQMTISVIDANGRKKKNTIPIYDATLEKYDDAFEILKMHLTSIGIENAETIVFAADGSNHIWPRIDNMIEEMGLPVERVRKVIDYFHVCEHLWSIVRLRPGLNDRERKKWVETAKNHLFEGDIDGLIQFIKTICRGRNAGLIRKEMRYFEKYSDLMKYQSLKDEKLPIGSGMVESAIRRVVNLRLKGSGMFWNRDNAEGFLHLRCHLLDGRWSELISGVSLFVALDFGGI